MLTPADLRILDHLENVPGLTAKLCAELELYPSEAAAKRGLKRLERAGLIRGAVFSVRPVEISGPLFEHPKGGELPKYKLETQIRNRYGAPVLARIYSLGEFRRPSQVDHELGVARCYVWFEQNLRREGWRWIPERPRRGGLVPDATLVRPDGTEIALDFIGEYRGPKIGATVSFFAARGVAIALF